MVRTASLQSPSCLKLMLNLKQIQHLPHNEIHQVIHLLRLEIEPRIRRTNDRAGEGEVLVVDDVDVVEGGFAVAEDEGAALLEGDHGGAGEEVGAAGGGDGAER